MSKWSEALSAREAAPNRGGLSRDAIARRVVEAAKSVSAWSPGRQAGTAPSWGVGGLTACHAALLDAVADCVSRGEL